MKLKYFNKEITLSLVPLLIEDRIKVTINPKDKDIYEITINNQDEENFNKIFYKINNKINKGGS